MKAFSAENLSAGYGKVKVIEDISFYVKKGEILTLLGANGSGKSTILKTLSGHLKKINGNIYIAECSLDKISEKELAKNLSVVLTEHIRPELMTCEDVVKTGRYPYTGRFGILSENDKKTVEESMKTVEMDSFKDNDFTKISDGQRQRVLLARAICQEPEILILDEPVSFLDIHHKIKFFEILQKLVKERNIAVIMSMHELEFAEKISDYIVCIKDKRVFCSGKSDEVFKDEIICQLFDIPLELYKKYRH